MNKEIRTLLEKHYDRRPNGWDPKYVTNIHQSSIHFVEFSDTETGKVVGLKMIVFGDDNGYKYYHMTYDMVHKVLLLIDTLYD